MKKYLLLLSFVSLYTLLNASEMPQDLNSYMASIGRYPQADQLATWWTKSSIQAGYATWKASQTQFSSGMDVSPKDSDTDDMDDNDNDVPVFDAPASTLGSGSGASSSTTPPFDDDDDDAETSAQSATADTRAETSATPTATDTKIDGATDLICELAELFSDDNRAKIQEAFNDNPYPDNISKKSRSLGRLGKTKREKNKAREKDKARHAHLKKMKKGEHNPAMKNKNSRGKKDKRTESQALAVGRYKN